MAIHILPQHGSAQRKVIRPTMQDVRLVENLCVRKTTKRDPPSFGDVVISKPWGVEYLCGRNEHLEVWELYINPKASTSLHCHPGKDTLNLVLEGDVILETIRRRQILRVKDFRVLKAGVVHRMMNPHPKYRVRVLEIESPPDKYNLIRVQDAYGRESMGYVPLRLRKLSTDQPRTRYCLLSGRRMSGNDKNFNLFAFVKTARGSSPRASGVHELILRQVTFDREKGELLNDIRQRSATNLIVTEGSLVLLRGNSVIKFLPGNCICNVPLWNLNWSATDATALLW